MQEECRRRVETQAALPNKGRVLPGASPARAFLGKVCSANNEKDFPVQPFDQLFATFESIARKYPHRSALEVNEQLYSYGDLYQRSVNLAMTIHKNDRNKKNLAAFLAYRSPTAYVAVLGILASRKGYVPLHPGFPIERTRKMLQLSGADIVVVGTEALPLLPELLRDMQESVSVICPDAADLGPLPSLYSQHRFITRGDCLEDVDGESLHDLTPASIAYLLFTSGSTGVPKGVPVSQSNVIHYLRYVSERYAIRPEDRFSQMFDMTFDPSVHDMFVCWTNGSCLYSVPQASLMAPSRFIREKQLTVWFSVPSVIMFMQKMRMLKPASLPTLRWSLFCGEPLPARLADSWQQAAPGSLVENLYGPTEATIAISHHRWVSGSGARCINGIVPIGRIFSTQKGCIIDRNRQLVPQGASGELCLSGSQVTSGYLNVPEKTREQFITLKEGGETWYRTGDLVLEDEERCLHYLGRLDSQVQVQGHRVELEEVDHVLREASKTDMSIAVAWPVDCGHADAIYGFICGGADFDVQRVMNFCKTLVPEYMVPRQIFMIEQMPLNVNGKIDRAALTKLAGELLNGHNARPNS